MEQRRGGMGEVGRRGGGDPVSQVSCTSEVLSRGKHDQMCILKSHCDCNVVNGLEERKGVGRSVR